MCTLFARVCLGRSANCFIYGFVIQVISTVTYPEIFWVYRLYLKSLVLVWRQGTKGLQVRADFWMPEFGSQYRIRSIKIPLDTSLHWKYWKQLNNCIEIVLEMSFAKFQLISLKLSLVHLGLWTNASVSFSLLIVVHHILVW